MGNNATIKVTANTKQADQKLQKIQQVTGSAGTALSGLGSTFSAFGSQAGAAGGAISNVAGMLATGGAWGVAVGAAVGVTALLVEQFMDARTASKELAESLDKSAESVTSLRDKMWLLGKTKAEIAAFEKLSAVHEEEAKLQEMQEKRDAFLKARGAFFSGGDAEKEKGYEGLGGAITAATEATIGSFAAPTEQDLMLQKIKVRAAKAAVTETKDLVEMEEEHNEALKKKGKLHKANQKIREEERNEAAEWYMEQQKLGQEQLDFVDELYGETIAYTDLRDGDLTAQEILNSNREYELGLLDRKIEKQIELVELAEKENDEVKAVSESIATSAATTAISELTGALRGEKKTANEVAGTVMEAAGQEAIAHGTIIVAKGLAAYALSGGTHPGALASAGIGGALIGAGAAGFVGGLALGDMESGPTGEIGGLLGQDKNSEPKDIARLSGRTSTAPSTDLDIGSRGGGERVVHVSNYYFGGPVFGNPDSAAIAVADHNRRGNHLLGYD